MRGAHLDVDQEREVVAGAQPVEVGAQHAGQAGRAGHRLAQRLAVARVGVELEPGLREQRALFGQGSGALDFGGEPLRRHLARLDVGLIEGIQPERGAGHRRRHLPAEELGAEVHPVGEVDPQSAWPELARAATVASAGLAASADPRALQSEVDEHPVEAVGVGRPSSSPSTGIRPLPCLPVDSASSCSAHAPKSQSAGEPTRVTLSCPACAMTASARPSATPGLRAAGTAGPRPRPAARRARGSSRDRRRAPPPAPARNPTAPSSGRRSRARRETRARSRPGGRRSRAASRGR